MNSKTLRGLAGLVLVGSSAPAFAITAITPNNLTSLASSDVSTLVQSVAIGADHRAYMPATALGMALGFDIGIDVTYFAFPSSFTNALAAASSQSPSLITGGLALPKLNIHKGLPFGIDVGGTFSTLSGNGQNVFTSFGLEAKYAIINDMALPTVAVRASYASNTLYFLNTSTVTADLVASKDLVLIDPYVGGGLEYWTGSISVPAGQQMANGVSNGASGINPHFYGGAMLKLGLFRVDGEFDYTTAGFTTFGAKVSLGF